MLRKLGYMGAAVIMIAAGVVIWQYQVSNLDFPEAPELAKVVLAFKGGKAPSIPLEKFLSDEKYKLEGETKDLPHQFKVMMSEGKWFSKPLRRKGELDALASWLDQAEKAMLAPGCTPTPNYDFAADNKYSYLRLMHLTRLLAGRAILRLQIGNDSASLALLFQLHDRFMEWERACPLTVLELMVLKVSIEQLHRAWSYYLVSPAPAPKTVQGIWNRMRAAESRKPFLANAVRGEAKTAHNYMKDQLAADMKKDGINEGYWFDRDQTEKMAKQFFRRQVWLLDSKPDTEAWRKPSPEENFGEKYRKLSKFNRFFSYNAAGTSLVMTSHADYRRIALRWYLDRCQLALQRLRWQHEAKARKLAFGDMPATDEAVNPFNGKKLVWPAGGEAQCHTPSTLLRRPDSKPPKLVSLPKALALSSAE